MIFAKLVPRATSVESGYAYPEALFPVRDLAGNLSCHRHLSDCRGGRRETTTDTIDVITTEKNDESACTIRHLSECWPVLSSPSLIHSCCPTLVVYETRELLLFLD
jgi:hypothetical protein